MGDAQQPPQFLRADPGPVGEQVQGELAGGFKPSGQQPIEDCPPGAVHHDVLGQGCPQWRWLRRQCAAPLHVGQDIAQVQGGGDGWGMPHRGTNTGQCRVPLQYQESREGRAGQQPAGVAQPHLVGQEQQNAVGQRLLPQTPEPLGKAGGSAVSPCRTTPMVQPSGRMLPASAGPALYHRRRRRPAVKPREATTR